MTGTTVRATIKNRADTAAAFAASNPILALGEIGVESDTLEFKIGDGVTAWSNLTNPYQTTGNADFTQNVYLNNANIVFEGATADDFETTLTVVDPTADRTITLPDITGTVITTGDTGTVTSTMIVDGAIVDADVNASAAIVGTKIDPDFGSQTIETTGDLVINTNTLFVDSSANNVGIGTTSPTFSNGSGLEVQRDGVSTLRIEDSSGLGAVLEIFADDGSRSAIYDSRGNSSNHGHEFRVNGSPQVNIDSSGRLLVGTATASVDTRLLLQGTSSNSSAGAYIHLQRGNLPTTAGAPTGRLIFADNSSNAGAWIDSASDGAWTSGTSYPGRLVFSTTADGASSPTERMRITENGTIYFHQYNGNPPSTTTFGIAFNRAASGSTNPGRVECYRNVDGTGVAQQFGGNAGQVYIKGDGDLENTNNSYAGISDIKLKENIVYANSQWNDLKALQVRNYNFKAETGYNTHTQIGLIAQEVELVSPGLIGESIDEETGESTKSVNYSVLYMKAVKALQEAMERIEVLEQRLTDAGIA
jgi:hypothetical protein